MPASGCEPSPRTRARSFCRWTCKSLSGDAFACRYPWHLPVAEDVASQGAEPWWTSWATIAPPAPGVGCWPGALPYSSERGSE